MPIVCIVWQGNGDLCRHGAKSLRLTIHRKFSHFSRNMKIASEIKGSERLMYNNSPF